MARQSNSAKEVIGPRRASGSREDFGSPSAVRSAARAKKRAALPEAVHEVLRSALRRHGLDEEIARYRFVLHWEEIVGKAVADRTRPECIRRGALVVRVNNSAWAQELSFRKEVILHRLQQFLDDGQVVRDVRFYVG